MVYAKSLQPAFLLPEAARFPSTRYQGSKAKLTDWIWQQIANLDFETCLDAFGGTGSVAYRLKQAGKAVTYNDLLKFNYHFGAALVANSTARLDAQDIQAILSRDPQLRYPTFIQDNFHDIYFTDAENAWLDQTITNIAQIGDPARYGLAFFALCQACIVKRPYNLFHRKNLYVRFAEVERSFGNKASWDRPFEEWFRIFVEEANQAVFDNGQTRAGTMPLLINSLAGFGTAFWWWLIAAMGFRRLKGYPRFCAGINLRCELSITGSTNMRFRPMAIRAKSS